MILLAVEGQLPLGAVLLLIGLSLGGLWLLDRDRLPLCKFERRGGRETALWRPVDVGLSILVFLLLSFSVAPPLFSLAEEGRLSEPVCQILVQVAGVGGTCAFIFWTVGVVYGQPLRALGLARSPLRNAPAVVACFVLSSLPLAAFNLLWSLGLEGIGLEKSKQAPVELFLETIRQGDLAAIAILLGGGLVVAPVCEEIIFRGFLFGLLRARLGFSAAAVISSALFALVHWPLFAMGPIFVVGALLCYIYERTGSLYYAMVYHLLFNATNFALMFFGVE